ncbi:MAG: DUF1553 domain-containing protein [Candidatus Hydrogenedentes bacterium]|nr:DUF1553 domain-containing protein [Candidatus Hydrogenedentota bacterium]
MVWSRRLARAALSAGIVAGASSAHGAEDEGRRYFTEKVRPILEANCFPCHGGRPTVKGEFRLTSREGLLRGAARGPAVDLQNPDASSLLAMISYKDEHHQMPPSGKLAEQDIETLAAWVRLGAPWDPEGADFGVPPAEEEHGPRGGADHWAYQPLARPEPPAVEPAWSTNPIDAFIKAKLDEAGLAPAPPSPRGALIRRAYYDLTGLPPSPEAVEAFQRDDSPDAYERLVEELLASPHYGERWARHWLDVAGYAETHGFERDFQKPFMWRYRDYVIRALNEDKPYDQFIREQIAGDELPGGGPDALIATGLYRLGIWDDEPADPLLGRYDELDGMVQTISAAFLGSTLGCARCHDHKIDPFPASDYYSMIAFIQDVKSSQRQSELTNVMDAEEQAAHDAAARQKEAEISALRGEIYDLERGYLARLAESRGGDTAGIVRSDLTDLTFRFYRDTWASLPDFDTLRPEDEGKLKHNFVTLAAASRQDAMGLVFEGKLRAGAAGEYEFHVRAKDGLRLTVNGQRIYDQAGTGETSGEARITLEPGFHTFRVDYFHTYGEPVLEIAWSGPGIKAQPLALAQPPADALNVNRLIKDTGREILAEAEVSRYLELEKTIDAAKKREIPGKYATTVTSTGPNVPPTHILLRGNPHVPGDEVAPRFPIVLAAGAPELPSPDPDAKTPGRRRVLAEWLASPENPLTARVMANRIWQYHFGRGIVRTSNDFGALGAPPTHPELLDWLASEFIAQGWSMKAMHRLIMLSNTYRMSSEGDAKALAADPDNNLFWRFDMRRLEAEEIRDSMLAANRTLNLKMGGPHVYPPMPAAVLATSSTPDKVWGTSPPEDHTRRSIYTHVKRSLKDPLLSDFDMADTESSCAVRFATTQPTQALNLLNSEFVNAQAEALAASIEAEGAANLETKVWLALNRVTQRAPANTEVDRGLAFIAEMVEKHGHGEQAAFERFCLLAINLNEFMYLD